MKKVKANNRDNFPLAVCRVLENRVACVCSKPGCGRITRGPHSDPSQSVNVGEAGHITAAASGGPRYDASLSDAQRRAAANGVWLCRVCHRLVDADESPFSVAELVKWKQDAETRARAALELGERRDRMPLLIAVLHRSMEAIPDGDLARSVPLLLREDGNREIAVDVRDLFGTTKPSDLKELVRRQVGGRDALWKMVAEYPGAEVAYYGIAHVPLAFHFGFLIGTRLSAHFAERDRDGSKWHWLEESSASFPPLELVSGAALEDLAEDVSVMISVSYEVSEAQVRSTIPEGALFHLRVSQPSLDLVRSKKQVEAYSEAFRSVLEKIARCPKVKRLHVFAATPMCVSLALGRQVRRPVHPDVYVYNFRRNDDPPYGWRLLLTEDAEEAATRA
jgi:SMODS-associated and fused to various effectors sensor domain